MPNQSDPGQDHDTGFLHDLPAMIGRRGVLLGLGALGATTLAAYGYGAGAEGTGTAADGSLCLADPAETSGPYPGDGTNAKAGQTINVLTQQGVIREDLRTSFAGMTPVAEGLPLTLEIRLVNVNAACTPLAGQAIYLWHCDTVGQYSLYDTDDRNYLRGVGISDANGVVRFTTIFPGCYDGRWSHMHFEIFASAEAAVSGDAALLTSQFALPEAECAAVYAADPRYPTSTANLGHTSLTRDMVFADNSAAQIAQQTLTLTGTPDQGYAGKVTVGLDL